MSPAGVRTGLVAHPTPNRTCCCRICRSCCQQVMLVQIFIGGGPLLALAARSRVQPPARPWSSRRLGAHRRCAPRALQAGLRLQRGGSTQQFPRVMHCSISSFLRGSR